MAIRVVAGFPLGAAVLILLILDLFGLNAFSWKTLHPCLGAIVVGRVAVSRVHPPTRRFRVLWGRLKAAVPAILISAGLGLSFFVASLAGAF
ncbi:MAG: hypothetical protein FJY81_00285 [Candidatus Aminicenantes bacterium]|nr:hypothetical protein [Candidatus Aminicenantes bacterium]